MKKIQLPGTHLQVSIIGMGTDLLGGEVDRTTSFRMLDHYCELGGSLIDTAHVYNNWIPGEKSRSEKLIGAWLRERGMKNQVRVATKGGCPELTSLHIPRLSRKEIVSDLEESLRFLGLDCIDLYWLHRDDRGRPVAELLETLNDQVTTGNIRYFGCSNWQIDRVREAAEYARKHGLQGFVGSQISWSLAVMNEEAKLDPNIAVMDQASLAYYRQTNLSVFAFYAIAKGYFAKVDRDGIDALKPEVKRQFHNETTWQRYTRAKQLADELSVSVNAVALAYIYSHPLPAIPIIGCRTVRQLEESLAHADLRLTGEMIRYLEG